MDGVAQEARYQSPVVMVEGVKMALLLVYDPCDLCEEDMAEVVARISDKLEPERAFIRGRQRGVLPLPARRKPCGCREREG